jgi:hypothetical protein
LTHNTPYTTAVPWQYLGWGILKNNAAKAWNFCENSLLAGMSVQTSSWAPTLRDAALKTMGRIAAIADKWLEQSWRRMDLKFSISLF